MMPDARHDRADWQTDRRQDGAGDSAWSDWQMLGERIRSAALAAATVHLIEAAGSGDERVAALETSPGKPGG
jgi:hypothetical protein